MPDLVIAQALLVQPVRTRNLLEGVDRRLNALGPGDRYELDVAVDVSNSKDSIPARLVVGIDGDASVLVEPDIEALKGVLR